MHIFLDESGCLGFDFDKKGTSRYFVITLLVASQAEGVNFAIRRTLKAKLRQKKKTRCIQELKGSGTTIDIKHYFYTQMLRTNDWHLNSIILDKTTVPASAPLKNNIDRLYNLLAKTLLQDVVIPSDERVVHLHVDRSKEKKEINIFDDFIRLHMETKLPANCTLNIEHLNSQNDVGLQAVDLFCYGIAKKYERNDVDWYNLFQQHIKREIIFRV